MLGVAWTLTGVYIFLNWDEHHAYRMASAKSDGGDIGLGEFRRLILLSHATDGNTRCTLTKWQWRQNKSQRPNEY